jgi:hypothetical protein
VHNVPLFKNIVVDTGKIAESFGSIILAVEVIEENGL